MEYAPVVSNSQLEEDSSQPEGFPIAEAAKLAPVGISEAQIRQAAATGRLRATILDPPRPRKNGRGRPVKILINRADLEAFVASKKKGAPRAPGAAPAADSQP